MTHELRQPLHHHRGREDARGRAGSAHDHDGDELQRLEQHEGVLGADRPLLEGEEPAGQPDDRSRERVREELGPARLDAEALGPGLDIAHREERAPGSRHRETSAHDQHRGHASEREDVEPQIGVQQGRPFEHLVGGGEVLPGEQEVLGRDLERQRGDRDLQATDAQ